MNWLKQQAANIAGTSEPIYGPSAIQTVGQRAGGTQHTVLKRGDFTWATPNSTCVETQVFYLFAKSGHIVMAQIIYSNVAGLRTTSQFNSKIFYPDEKKAPLWSSDPLQNHTVTADHTGFKADKCSVELSEDGSVYTIKSTTNHQSIVDLKVTNKAPAFAAGKDGVSNYGKNPEEPWGTMTHKFWPRAEGSGTVMTKEGPISLDGSRAIFIHALQGMKPHHAAAKWNFIDFQGPTFSAALMEFTTPPSYGDTKVAVGGIAKDGELVFAGTDNTVKHVETTQDADIDWPAPTSAEFKWAGTTSDGKPCTAEIVGSLGRRLDRVDVMAEVPGFIKSFVGAAVGTKPYIYQFSPQTERLKLKVTVDGQETVEEGDVYYEATFISA